MNIAWYIRVSTNDQREGLAMYKSQATEFCQRYNHTLIEIFSDEDVSGGIDLFARPAGKSLLKALNEGIVDAVASPNVSRLFRDLRDGVNTLHTFGKKNWQMYVGDGYGLPIDVNTPMGFSMIVDHLKYAQLERMHISERTTRGLAFRRKKGMATSHTPYGYFRTEENTSLHEDKTQMAVVKKIIEANENGISTSKIASILNQNNVPTKTGATWYPSTITKIIKYQQSCKS